MKHVVHEVNLGNGAKGLLIHVPDASVMTFDLNFRAGEYLVTKDKWETPHLMEHLLLGANEYAPKARTFQAEFEKNGAYSNASTGSYDISYEAECAEFEWRRIFKLLRMAITKPLFLAEEFAAEIGNVREELTARSNNHFRHLSLALREQYGFYVLTDKERLQNMENVLLDDIRKHYESTHTTSNLRFVIAGNLPEERRKEIEKLLASLSLPAGDGRKALPDELPNRLKKPLYIHNDTVDNMYFYMDTFTTKPMNDAELDALSLINSMLTETLYSRILGTARERGLVYGMSSSFSRTKDTTNWWFGAQVRPTNAPALFDIMVSELEKVFSGELSDVDIESAKQYALGRYQRSGQTVGGTANSYAQRYFFDEAIDDYYSIPDRIKAITRQRIVASAQKLFEDKIWGFGVLGNAGPTQVTRLHSQLKTLWN